MRRRRAALARRSRRWRSVVLSTRSSWCATRVAALVTTITIHWRATRASSRKRVLGVGWSWGKQTTSVLRTLSPLDLLPKILNDNFQPRSLRWPTWRRYGSCTFGSFFLGTSLHLIYNWLGVNASSVKVAFKGEQMLRVMFTQRISSTAARSNPKKAGNVLPSFVLCYLRKANFDSTICSNLAKLLQKETNCEKM